MIFLVAEKVDLLACLLVCDAVQAVGQIIFVKKILPPQIAKK
jgi:hypothetical protein